MEFWLARAMQMSYLDESQIQRIQLTEKNIKPWPHCIANGNIQEILQVPPIRQRWGIPDDAESQAKHAQRIEMELKRINIAETPYGRPGEVNYEATHSMDLAVFNLGPKIVWDYSAGRGSGGNLRKRLQDQFS